MDGVRTVRRAGLVAALLALVAACSDTEDPETEGSKEPSSSSRASSSAPHTRPPDPTFEPREDLILGRIDTGTGSGPSGIAVGHGSVWVTTHRSGELLRIDPGTGRIVARIAIPAGAGVLEPAPVVTPDAVILCGADEDEFIVTVDPATNKVRTKPLGCLAYGTGPLGTWVASRDRLTQIDPVTLKVLRVLHPDVPSVAFNADLVQADGSLWVSHAGDYAALYRIDPGSGEILGQWTFGYGNFALAQIGRRIYYTNPVLHEVSVVDAATNTVILEKAVPGDDEGDPILTAWEDQLWASTLNGGVARLDPETLDVLGSADLGDQDYVGELAVEEGRVWYPTYGGDQVLEVKSRF